MSARRLRALAFLFFTLGLLCKEVEGAALTNVWAWGNNDYGQCNVPPDITNAIRVAAGSFTAMALTADGRVRAWGYGDFGLTNAPVDLSNAVDIAVGEAHGLALLAGGTVRAWGYLPDVPDDLTNVVAISAGAYYSLALQANGRVRKWPTDVTDELAPPADLTNAVAIAAGAYNFAYALRANGTVRAWGRNDFGELNVPSGLTNVIAIATGGNSGLALKSDGTVRAWGYTNDLVTQVPAGLSGVVAIEAYGCGDAVRTNGVLRTWGGCSVPTSLPFVKAVAAGAGFTVALVDPNGSGVPPSVLAQPRDQTAAVGSTAYFTVMASGFPPLRYQWYFSTNRVLNATNSVLTLPDLQPQQSGLYHVVVTNGSGSATSESASLSVVPTLDVTFVPAVLLRGGVGMSYRLDYINAVGPTNQWVALATLTLTNSPQYYFDVSAIGQPTRFYRLVQLP